MLDEAPRSRPRDEFAAAVLKGLAQRPQKIIPARFFYDRRGSELFEAITRLPEYYPTRTEIALIERHAARIAERVGSGLEVVEFGSGSSAKTLPLLRQSAARRYVPIDISSDFLDESVRALATLLPAIELWPIAADFTCALELPAGRTLRPRLGLFLGSTIGNLGPAAAVDLLRCFRSTLGTGAHLVIGIDLLKEPGRLQAAYDDVAGVTAAFNLNLLHRINRELHADLPIDAFRHRAVWNAARRRVEMHLVAARDLRFTVAGRSYTMAAGETIHTENSHKYAPEDVGMLARASGWDPLEMWMDPERLFALCLWRAVRDAMEP